MTEMASAANNQGGGSSSRSENGTSDINILLLGETGVGKSTFINAFANYLTFEKMPDGDSKDLVCLIPTSFTMYDHNDVEQTIQFGEETKHEAQEIGNSATQSPGCYEFPLDDRTIRIIDTPGIGDTRGIKQDSINFENILTYISHYEALHCICILLKPNNARLTIIFDFCIKQLLCHLQKDASKNIVFLYTNSRGTFYKPGDTGPILAKMLNSIENSPPFIKITYNPSTRYCLDNESFRFLMAVKCGVEFDENTKREFSASWDNSVKECRRLMKYIIGYPEENISPLPSHRIRDTVSLNTARRMILELSQPLAEIIDNISLNLEVFHLRKKQIEENSTDIKSLKNKLYIRIISMEVVPFDRPQTICTAAHCSEVKVMEGVQRYIPKKVCHNACRLKGITGDIIGPSGLQKCDAMDKTTGTCNECGCSYQIHIHKHYGVKEVAKLVIDNTVKTQINVKSINSKEINKHLKINQDFINKYNKEKAFITKVMAEFACFLRDNAILSYNDAFKKYLEYRIHHLETLKENGVDNKTIINGLQQMIKDYEAQITQIDIAMKGADTKQSEPNKTDTVKKLDEAKKSDEVKKADEAKKHDEMKKADEAKKSDEAKKPDVAKKADEAMKSDKVKKDNEAKKPDEAKKLDEVKKDDETKKPDEVKNPDESKKPDEAKKPDKAKKTDEAKKSAEAMKSDKVKKPDEVMKSDKVKKPDEVMKSGEVKKSDEAEKSDEAKKPDEVMKSDGTEKSDEASCQELTADYIFEKIEQLKGLEFSGKTIAAMQKAQQDGMKGMSVHRVAAVTTPKDNTIFDFTNGKNASKQDNSKMWNLARAGARFFQKAKSFLDIVLSPAPGPAMLLPKASDPSTTGD